MLPLSLPGRCWLVEEVQCGIDLLQLLLELFPLPSIVGGAELREKCLLPRQEVLYDYCHLGAPIIACGSIAGPQKIGPRRALASVQK